MYYANVTCDHVPLGHVSIGVHGSTWWWTDGGVQTTAEQVQSYQYDIPTCMLLNLYYFRTYQRMCTINANGLIGYRIPK